MRELGVTGGVGAKENCWTFAKFSISSSGLHTALEVSPGPHSWPQRKSVSRDQDEGNVPLLSSSFLGCHENSHWRTKEKSYEGQHVRAMESPTVYETKCPRRWDHKQEMGWRALGNKDRSITVYRFILQPWSPLETISQPFSFKVATTARK